MKSKFFHTGIAAAAAAVLAASGLVSVPMTAASLSTTSAATDMSSFMVSDATAPEAPAAVQDTVVTHVTDSVKIFFPLNSSVLDLNFGGNPTSLGRLGDIFGSGQSSWNLPQTVKFVGGASPEGSVQFNANLSANRAKTASDYFTSNFDAFSSVSSSTASVGRDWEGLLELVKQDPAVPFKDQTVALLQVIVDRIRENGEKDSDNYVGKLQDFLDGAPYYYLNEYVFPKLRAAKLVFSYDLVSVEEKEEPQPAPAPAAPVVAAAPEEEPAEEPACKECRPFYMAITTNMLYDLAMTPNLGAEFYLGRGWSLGADWQYAWWKNDDKAFYWRIYGGDLVLRKYFGKKAKEKPLQGHHLGLYGQMFTYDFEFGGIGRDAAKTDGTVLWHWGAGLEYGYTLPVAPRLNIDFSIGVGYAGGKINKYDPDSGHYYWQETHRENYVGPTRASIGLIWLIGCGNYNHVGRRADR